MNRVLSLILFVPILFISFIYLYYAKVIDSGLNRVSDYHLKLVANYASDSAIEEMLDVADLGTDYVEWGKFNTDPEIALKDYIDTFLISYNLPLTPENREMVKINFLKVFVVAGYDGYYVYDHRSIDEGSLYEFVCSNKLPYLYKDMSKNDREVSYALTMGTKCYRVTNATLNLVNSPLPKSQTLEVINSRISDDLINRIDRQYTGGWNRQVYLPNELTSISKVNPIAGPTVLALVDNVDLSRGKKVNAFGIGGAMATVARPISAYERKGADGNWVKYYCYSDLLPEDISGDRSVIKEVFMRAEDAAKAGYHYDSIYMNRR